MTPYGKMILYYSLIAVLIVLSSFFSCADMVYSSVSIAKLKKRGKKGRSAIALTKDYDQTIITILFGNNLANVIASSLGAAIALLDLPPYNQNSGLAATIIELSMLGIILIFGEILPKTIGRRYCTPLAIAFAPIVKGLSFVFFPFVKASRWLTSKITSPLIGKLEKEDEKKTDEELQAMVDEIEDEGIIDEGQSELLSRSLEFKDTEAYMVMTARVKIEGIEMSSDLRKVVERGDFTHSRLPVYRGNMDEIVGYIPLQTLQKAVLSGKNPSVEELKLPILTVPRTMPISAILSLFKESHRHIALVKDEFGGNEGILTLEDILEELVGEMYDESEKKPLDVEPTDKKNVFLVKGTMKIDDFFSYFGMEFDAEEPGYTTVSGWITDMIERFPVEGDSFKYGKVDVNVEKASPFTVEVARVNYHPRRKIKAN